jgi:2-polyprenyl-3-methyl-5-hydroxy-6-metoxy-1,4-benzoquinol methylase
MSNNTISPSPDNPSIFTDLHVLNEAVRYRRWLFSLIQPHIGQRILEVGSGIGNYTDMLLDKECVVATDIAERYVQILKQKYQGKSNVHVLQLDLDTLSHSLSTALQGYRLDTVINMNVLEHIEGDVEALRAIKRLIHAGGKIITIVPSFQKLFGSLDEAYGHYRRYSKSDFIAIAQQLDLSLICMRYFNVMGILGWIYSSKLRRKRTLSRTSVAVFDRLIAPVCSVVEKKINPPFGLSLLAVLQKP